MGKTTGGGPQVTITGVSIQPKGAPQPRPCTFSGLNQQQITGGRPQPNLAPNNGLSQQRDTAGGPQRKSFPLKPTRGAPPSKLSTNNGLSQQQKTGGGLQPNSATNKGLNQQRDTQGVWRPGVFTNKGLDQEEIDACVKNTNKYRTWHANFEPIHWDPHLAQEAQKHANKLLEMSYQKGKPQLVHESPQRGMGENLYWADDPNAKTYVDANKNWYSEEKNYSYSSGGSKNGYAFGHFTQMVWKGSTKFGVGVANGKSITSAAFGNVQTYVVAKYHPQGNITGEYSKNVGKKIHFAVH